MDTRKAQRAQAPEGVNADQAAGPAWLRFCACLALAGWIAATLQAADPVPTSIPLCPGLTIVTAVNQTDGDYESIKTIESVTSAGVVLKYSMERRDTDLLSSNPGGVKRTAVRRTVLAQDMQSATRFQQAFFEKSAEAIPGTTAIGASTLTLRDLKSKGDADFGMSFAVGDLELTADREHHPNYYDYILNGKFRRVGQGPVPVRVLVNDAPVDLPAIHAEGVLGVDKIDFHVLDDEKNPLVLRFRIGIGAIKPLNADERALCKSMLERNGSYPPDVPFLRCSKPEGGDRDTLQVVKISYRCGGAEQPGGGGGGSGGGGGQGGAPPIGGGGTAQGGGAPGGQPGKQIEQSLADTGRAVVYGIYFSFGSDTIREESEPVLKEIADALGKNPTWRLNVEGHTDNIGGGPFNQDLSNRRAAAVKKALVDRYRVAPERLAPAGFGASRPKATNDTLEGRALNRRVELAKR